MYRASLLGGLLALLGSAAFATSCDAGSASAGSTGGAQASGGSAGGAKTVAVSGGAAAGGSAQLGGTPGTLGGAGSPVAGQGGNAPVTSETLAVTVSGGTPRAVSADFFGQNYWSWVKAWGDSVALVNSAVAAINLGLLRAGGAVNETGDPEPFSLAEIDSFVSFAKLAGARPLLQVSVINNQDGGVATAADAAAVVKYVNQTKAYGVRYFSIGNEPDLYTDHGLAPATFDATAACARYGQYADAMRAIDPSIQLMGPDLSWKYQASNDWLTPFLAGCGKYLAVVTVHRYPLAPTACTEQAAYADAAAYRLTLQSLRATMKATGQADKPLAITEANITYDGTPETSVLPASPGTFPAGLWLADNLGVSLEEGLHSVSYWSLSEGWTLGFFDGASPRPAAQVLKLFATRFGTQVLEVTGATAGVSVYAGRSPAAAKSTVFVVNKTAAIQNLTLTLLGLPRSDAPALKVPPTALVVADVPDSGEVRTVTVFAAGMAEPAAQ